MSPETGGIDPNSTNELSPHHLAMLESGVRDDLFISELMRYYKGNRPLLDIIQGYAISDAEAQMARKFKVLKRKGDHDGAKGTLEALNQASDF